MPPESPIDRNAPSPPEPSSRRRFAVLAWPSKLWRWAIGSPLRATLVAIACIASLSGVVAAWGLLRASSQEPPEAVLAAAMRALDAWDHAEAERLATQLRDSKQLPTEQWGGPVFILGVLASRQADEMLGRQRAARSLLAARYLEEARNRGFPPGRRGEGFFLLARSLYHAGQLPAARMALKEALPHCPTRQAEIHQLLAATYLDDATPRLDEAMAENRRFLESRGLSEEQRAEGLLQQAKIFMRQGKTTECAVALRQIPRHTVSHGEATVLLGQIQLEEARTLAKRPEASAAELAESRRKYQEAIQTFRIAQSRDTLSNVATRQSQYLIGVCLTELGDERAAIAQFERIGRLFPETPESFAADFRRADLLRRAGRDAEAASVYRQVLRAVIEPENYSNPWLPIESLRQDMVAAYQHYVDTGQFDGALEIAKSLSPLFPRTRAMQLTAETYAAWGKRLLEQSETAPPAQRGSLAMQGRARYRRAGRTYRRLAELMLTSRQYPEILWRGATALMWGQDFAGAKEMLDQYLRDRARERHPQALVMLGQALLSLGQVEPALEALGECIDFYPRDAAAYRARLLAAQASMEKGDARRAESLLMDNLGGEFLTPASIEWRDSLFLLGQLLYQQGRYEEAVRRLEEAVARYPETPKAVEARYLAARGYQRAAEDLRDRIRQNLAGATRPSQTREYHDLLSKALEAYRQLQTALLKRQQDADLPDDQKAILRNCYFAIGGVLFELGQYEAAIEADSATVNRYQNQPEALDAYLRIAWAYRRLGRTADARSAIEQAKTALARMKPDADFQETTNYSREQWSQLLDSLAAT